MTKQHLTAAFTVDKTPDEAFAAINNVRAWWSGEIDGVTDQPGAEWTYRYKDIHYSKQKIVELIPAKKVVFSIRPVEVKRFSASALLAGLTFLAGPRFSSG